MRALTGAEPQEFPHQVYVSNGNSACGGTIYNDRFIITAGHRLVDENNSPMPAENFTVVAGSNIEDIQNRAIEYSYKVRRTFVNEEFTWKKCELYDTDNRYFSWMQNDIGLLLLRKRLLFSERIRPLQLAPNGFDPSHYSNQVLTVGWGKPNGYKSAISLLKGNRKLRPKTICGEVIDNTKGYFSIFTNNQKERIFCSGGVVNDTDSGISRRMGESGGPVICINSESSAVLCGVHSSGLAQAPFYVIKNGIRNVAFQPNIRTLAIILTGLRK